MQGTRFSLEVQPTIPKRLKGLTELANDLMYSWDSQIRRLFFRLDSKLWEACGHNPKVFLRRVAQERLDEQANNPTFMEDYNRALSAYNSYHREKPRLGVDELLDPHENLIAYFCAEFAFHESLPIYSGGLGILAGDHCKAASDLGVPFIAVGLLYRQGYFTQTIDENGSQIAHYAPTKFQDLPIVPAVDLNGDKIRVAVDLPGRSVLLRVWRAKAGHITLYLLDSDLKENSEDDRSITYQLYGGDKTTRIQQEIVLGIGGVRALQAVGLKPSAWHINEGHSAFQILERCRQLVHESEDFHSALEWVAATTIFTTHTPVPAGHDIFDHSLMMEYFKDFVRELGIDEREFLNLGSSPSNQGGFNQTSLALRGSRFHNGVSRIHGSVASHMEGYVWPQIPNDENPIRYVTNGVHVQTFLSVEWANLFTMRCGGEWRNELMNVDFWERIKEIPDHSFWSLHQSLKSEMLHKVRDCVVAQHRRNGVSAAHIDRLTRYIDPNNTDILTVGFARRFATYKRAALIFSDKNRLARLLGDEDHPMVLIFAGKAHPSDIPGQQLIRTIHEYAQLPEFEGRIILLEGYDMAIARRLVQGVDVWLNTPEYPLEASGTSGEKAGINGVLNLSVLDGWWDEGYNGKNGWAITPHDPHTDPHFRDVEEANELLSILEDQVIPLYYDRGHRGYSPNWVAMSKESMSSLLPRFNSQRMVMDYVRDFYGPASRQGRLLREGDGSGPGELSRWKKKISKIWPNVSIQRVDIAPDVIISGEALPIRVAANLDALNEMDVTVECLFGVETDTENFSVHERFELVAGEKNENGDTIFELNLTPPLAGLQHYKVRMYPTHPMLSHKFETGCLIWL